jgi:nucleoside-diphosphate-sugar epimerase
MFSHLAVGFACALVTCVWLIRKSNMKKNLNRFLSPSIEFKVFLAKQIDGARTVLITGGNGFVGKYISSYMADKHLNVVVFDISVPDESNRQNNISYICGNLLNSEHIERALKCFKSVDSVIHTASLIPFLGVPDEAIWTVNVDGTKNLLNVCVALGVRSFIYTSSATAVLDLSTRVSKKLKEDCPAPKQHIDTYAKTKFTAERLVIDANNARGMVTCVLRPCAIYGRGDKVMVDKTIFGLDPFYMGDGSARIDWVPVEAVARAHVLAEETLFADEQRRQRMQGATYFIGNNEERQYGWFMGAPMDGDAGGPVSHWGHPRPQRLPLALVMGMAYLNLAVYTLIGAPILPPFLAPSLVDFTQRTYTFCSDRAARDFGYAPAESVADSIKRLVAEEARRRTAAGAGAAGPAGHVGR